MLHNPDLKTTTQEAMDAAGLSAKERHVLQLRYLQGFNCTATRKHMSLSRTRTAHLEAQALRKLRQVSQRSEVVAGLECHDHVSQRAMDEEMGHG